MQAYRIETTLTQDGTLTVSNLPLRAGEAVEIIILVHPPVGVYNVPRKLDHRIS